MKGPSTKRSVSFPLDVEDGWPPVAVESLAFDVVPGGLKLLVPPLFVKRLSVGDVISVREKFGQVTSWKHKRRSRHSTIWLMETASGAKRDLQRMLKRLHEFGCSSAHPENIVVYAIDVPPEVPIRRIDAALASLDPEKVAVAYPSFRHSEP